jgi:secondary thiamine-phosphate synthase enzyme
MPWFQRVIQLPPCRRGLHLITDSVVHGLREIEQLQVGLLHVFLLHTSASLIINENADPDVPADLESMLNALVPEGFDYRHTVEGPDDMPAHVKVALLGNCVSVPIREGQLALGTWQGIFLCEHRNRATGRKIVLTAHGETEPSPRDASHS